MFIHATRTQKLEQNSSKYLSPCSSIETLWQNGFSFIYSCRFNYMKRILFNQVCFIKLWGALFYGLLGHLYDCFSTGT